MIIICKGHAMKDEYSLRREEEEEEEEEEGSSMAR